MLHNSYHDWIIEVVYPAYGVLRTQLAPPAANISLMGGLILRNATESRQRVPVLKRGIGARSRTLRFFHHEFGHAKFGELTFASNGNGFYNLPQILKSHI